MTETTPARETRPAAPLSMTEIVFPGDLNANGTMFGGKVVAIMDICAGLCVSRWSRRPSTTAAIDAIAFSAPIRQGQILQATARIVYVGRTSCMVKVGVFASDIVSGDEFYCCEGYFSIVALDSHSRPTPLPLLPPDAIDQVEWDRAHRIKENMLAHRGQAR